MDGAHHPVVVSATATGSADRYVYQVNLPHSGVATNPGTMTREPPLESARESSSWPTPFRELATMWARSVRFSIAAATDANRILFASFADGTNEGSKEPAPVPSLAYTKADWQSARSVDSPEDISVGDDVTFSKPITDADVRSFAEASGDTNRLHLDEEYAEGTRFGGRIAHGTLVTGLISAALALLPGTVVYLSQETSFREPVPLGETLTATCRVVEEIDRDRYRLATTILNRDGDCVIDGEATILVDPLPGESDEP